MVWLYGKQTSDTEISCATIEWMDETRREIRRLVIYIYHREGFFRSRAHAMHASRDAYSFRERLIDYLLILLYGETHLPTMMSTANWFFHYRTGTLIPVSAITQFRPNNDTLSEYLSRPGRVLPNFRTFVSRLPQLSARKKTDIKTFTRVIDKDYWKRPSVIAIYGNYMATYRSMQDVFEAVPKHLLKQIWIVKRNVEIPANKNDTPFEAYE